MVDAANMINEYRNDNIIYEYKRITSTVEKCIDAHLSIGIYYG